MDQWSGLGVWGKIQRCSYCFVFVCWKIIKLINKHKSPIGFLVLGFLSSNFLNIPSMNSSNSNLKMPRTEQPQMSQSLLRSCTINLWRLTFFLHHCQSASRFHIKEGYTPGEMLSAGPHSDKEEKTFLMKIELSFPDLNTSCLQKITCHYLQIGLADVQSKEM